MKRNFTVTFFLIFNLALECHCSRKDNNTEVLINNQDSDDNITIIASSDPWPQNYGEGYICLWKDDKIAAFSLTIDDNNAPDHPWWIEQGDAYGFKFTWFVITERLDTGAFWGTWEDYRSLFEKGHSIQSHTVTHLDLTLSIDDEYRISKEVLETEIPGNVVLTIAYPGGSNKELNDIEVAKKYYIGGRGTTGLSNRLDTINYMQINSIGAPINLTTDVNAWSSLPNIIVSNPDRVQDYRAWQVVHYHSLTDELKSNAIETFNYLKTNENYVWVGLFKDVTLYAQERDNSKIGIFNISETEIRFKVFDELDNKIFNYPLTVKVRLDEQWQNLTATQAGNTITSRIITFEGTPYALVEVVPDAGDILLTR